MMMKTCIGPRTRRCDGIMTSNLRVCRHLSLEVEQSQCLELNVGFGAQVASQGARQVLQLLDTMRNSSLQSAEEQGREVTN